MRRGFMSFKDRIWVMAHTLYITIGVLLFFYVMLLWFGFMGKNPSLQDQILGLIISWVYISLYPIIRFYENNKILLIVVIPITILLTIIYFLVDEI
jgi:hypothetical protein